MRFEPFILCAALLCPSFTDAAEPVAEVAAPRVPEPNVQRTVIEDSATRIEQLNVRGQTRSIVVTNKGALAGSYEIHLGDPSRDLSDGAGSPRGAVGQRMWRLFEF
jgi:hypothetical protein